MLHQKRRASYEQLKFKRSHQIFLHENGLPYRELTTHTRLSGRNETCCKLKKAFTFRTTDGRTLSCGRKTTIQGDIRPQAPQLT
ncbi:hypothetical protein TNCV_5012061 [Trichonephila clavipes]|nr:hypothetical protein TNCV_5012061 [Trichonephila clavipes]